MTQSGRAVLRGTIQKQPEFELKTLPVRIPFCEVALSHQVQPPSSAHYALVLHSPKTASNVHLEVTS